MSTNPKHFRWQRGPAEPAPRYPDDDDDELADAGLPEASPASPSGQRVPHKRMRLSCQEDIARQLRRLFAAVQRGEISGIEATRRAKVLNSLASVMTASSIEKRLASVEKEIVLKRRPRG